MANETDMQEIRYNFHEYVAPFRPETMLQYKAPGKEGITVFRSCVSWLPKEIDHIPLMLRPKPGKRLKPAYTCQEVKEMDESTRIKNLNHLALSCNLTYEDAEESLKKKLTDLKKKGLPKEKIDAMMEQRGLFIGAFLITPEHGLITDFNDGHGNILLYEGVKLVDMVIPDIPPVKFEYEL